MVTDFKKFKNKNFWFKVLITIISLNLIGIVIIAPLGSSFLLRDKYTELKFDDNLNGCKEMLILPSNSLMICWFAVVFIVFCYSQILLTQFLTLEVINPPFRSEVLDES